MRRLAFPGLLLRRLLGGWLFLCAVGSADAYVLEGPRWASNTTIAMHLQLGNPGSTLLDGATSWDDVAAAALDIWNANLGSGVQFQRATTTAANTSHDGQSSVFFSNTVFGTSFGDDTVAVTRYYYSGSTFSEADVVVNAAKSFNSYRGPLRGNVPDLRRILLHEFGHVLGLNHVAQSTTAIMVPVINDLDTIQADDIAGVTALYGAPPVVVSVTVPSVTLEASVASVTAGSGDEGVFTLRLSRAASSVLTVNYAVSGKAVNGVDYVLLKGTKRIKVGKTSSLIKVIPLGTGAGRGVARTVKLRLAAGTGYTIGSAGKVTVRIIGQ